jgi:RNA polymerase sigma factor (sigma-70 family)
VPTFARTDTSKAPEEPASETTDRYQFPATQWSLVAKAVAKDTQEDTQEGEQAMAAICERYWLPLYAFARRSGCNPQDAEDMTQGFIYTIIRRNGLKSADATKGRLRSFLIAGMRNQIISVHRKQSTQIRGADKIVRNLTLEQAEQLLAEDESDYSSASESPSQVFERRWALALLDRVLERLESAYRDKGETKLFLELRPFLHGKRSAADGAYQQVAKALGISSNLVGVRIHRMKRLYRELLREEIVATVDESEVDSEIEYLFSVFQR